MLGIIGRAGRWFFSGVGPKLERSRTEPVWLIGEAKDGEYAGTLGGFLGLRLPQRQEMIEAFSMILARHQEASYILTMLVSNMPPEPTDMATYFKVGTALAELARLDPLFQVARPGIEAYYARYSPSEYPDDTDEMVHDIVRTIKLALRSPSEVVR